jgi:uncharacterized membrane protein YgcG
MEGGLVICKGHSPQDPDSWDPCAQASLLAASRPAPMHASSVWVGCRWQPCLCIGDSRYSGHSFRIGAATAAAKAVETSTILKRPNTGEQLSHLKSNLDLRHKFRGGKRGRGGGGGRGSESEGGEGGGEGKGGGGAKRGGEKWSKEGEGKEGERGVMKYNILLIFSSTYVAIVN